MVVDINNKPVRKELAKNPTRNRRLQLSSYIQNLIDQVDDDVLVPMNDRALDHRWIKLQHDNGLSHYHFPWPPAPQRLCYGPTQVSGQICSGTWQIENWSGNEKIYVQTFHDEHVRVDNTIDKNL